ncbi:MAG: hypothetical protein ACR2PV_05750, partial [Gammaproteobacteria bacterium]
MTISFSITMAAWSAVENKEDVSYTPTTSGGTGTVNYSLDPTTSAGGVFDIDATTGEVSLASGEELDYETNSEITFTIIATDSTNVSAAQSVTLRVINLLDEEGEVVLTLPTIDENGEIVSRYELDDNEYFSVNEKNQIVLKSDFAPEQYDNYFDDIVLHTYYPSGHAIEQNLRFLVSSETDKVEVVVWRDFATEAISLDEEATQLVQKLSAIDQDGKTITSYSLSGVDTAYFSIDSDKLYLLNTADYEDTNHNPIYEITVIAHADDGTTGQQNITINLQDVMGLVGGVITKEYNEEDVSGSVIYTATVEDAGDDVVYSLYELGGGDFLSIDSQTGEITFNGEIDVGSYMRDNIDITPLTASDKVVVSAVDELNNISLNDLITKRMVVVSGDDGTTEGIFSVMSDSFFNSAPEIKLSMLEVINYSVVIYATAGEMITSQILVLTINPESSDNFLTWSSNQDDMEIVRQDYDMLGDNFFTLAAENVDSDSGLGIWYKISGDDSELFSIDINSGIVSLRRDAQPSLDTNQQYSFYIHAWSGDNGPSIQISKLIILYDDRFDVTADNDIFENNAANIQVATFQVGQIATGEEFSYSLSGDDADYFSVASDTGILTLQSVLDYEDANQPNGLYSLVIHADNGQAVNLSTSFVLSLLNSNDNRTEWSGTQPDMLVISETAGLGDVNETEYLAVATFNVSDADGDEIEYAVALDGALSSDYTMDSDGVLYIARGYTYLEFGGGAEEYSFVIYARGTSGGEPTGDAVSDTTTTSFFEAPFDGWITTNFVLSIANINDEITTWFVPPPSVVAISETVGVSDMVALSAADYVSVATFTPLDYDGDGSEFEYDITGADANYFSIGSDGILILVRGVDYESLPNNYSIVVSAIGTAGGDGVGDAAIPITQAFVLSIIDVDETVNDNLTTWSVSPPTDFTIDETAGVSDVVALTPANYEAVATFIPTDPDGDGFEYDIMGADASFFTIDDSDGILKLKYQFDYESPPNHYSIIISVRGTAGDHVAIEPDGAISITQIFVLSVGNLNDEATEWSVIQPNMFVINETDGVSDMVALTSANYEAVATFTPTDPDGDGFEYNISGDDAIFFTIDDSDNILKLIYQLDYESRPDIYSIVISVRGTDGGDGVADGMISITQAFALSIANLNDEITAWSDTPPTDFTINETTGVSDMVALTPANYEAVATFTPMDADGDGFEYRITGQDASFFAIGSDGMLLLKYQFDYESSPNNYSIIVEVRGTTGGAGVGDGALWVTQAFVLSVDNLNDESTEWSVSPPTDSTINETLRTSDMAALNEADYVTVATFIATDPDGDGFVYNITGVDANYFSIGSDGVLKLVRGVNYESAHSANYSIVISAIGTAGGDGVADGAISIIQAFVLSVADVDEGNNDDITEWSGTQPSTASIDETAGVSDMVVLTPANYEAVATFTPIDADGTDFEYNISGSNASFFTIDGNGVLSIKYQFDYESHPDIYTIVISVRGTAGDDMGIEGDGAISITQAFVLSVVNINDEATIWSVSPPIDSTISEIIGVSDNVEVSETEYVLVATFIPTDPDGDGFEYDIMGAGASFFTIGSDGILKLKYELDREAIGYADGNYSVIVMVRGTAGDDMGIEGDGAISLTQLFVLSVANVNDEATEWSVSPPIDSTISETAGVNDSASLIVDNYQAVATFTPTDADGDGFAFSLGGAAASFFIIGSDGILKLKYELDREATGYADGNYSITISVIGTVGGEGVGDGAISITQAFVLSVADINDEATEWSVSPPTDFTINETAGVSDTLALSAAEYVAVATFTPTDADGDGFEYNISGNDVNFFTIDGNGVLSIKYQFDYESQPNNYSIIISAIGTAGGDGVGDGATPITQAFVLSVANIDDEITAWSGTPPTDFVIDETAGVSNSVSLNVGNYQAVATFIPTDPDVDGFVFTLSGAATSFFAIGSDGILKLKYQLDREAIGYADGNYSIIVEAIGSGAGVGSTLISQAFVLSVKDLNDEATIWSGTQPNNFAIDETAGVSNSASLLVGDYEAVATFVPIDADGDGFEYNIIGIDASFFSIGSDGVLLLKYALDYESVHSANYSIIISAIGTAGGGGVADGAISITQAFVLSVRDIDANPNNQATEWSGIQPSSFSIDEMDGISNVPVATFTPTDPDGDGFEYGIMGQDVNFFIIGSDGILKLRYQLDYEAHPDIYSVVISVRGTAGDDAGIGNDGAISVTQVFVLSVGNLNDEATEWSDTQPSAFAVDESAGVSDFDSLIIDSYQAVATFTPIDADGDRFEYNISGVDANYFLIGSDGILKLTRGVDGESAHGANYSVIISVRGTTGGAGVDDGTLWISQAFVLAVGNINDNITEWSGSQPTDFTINETAGVSNSSALIVDNYQSVATFIPTDPDGDGFEYNITGAAASFFMIGSDSILKLKYQLDREATGYADGNYSIVIEAIGTAGGDGIFGGAISITQAFVLSVGNLNDEATEWPVSSPIDATIDETAGVSNSASLIVDNYQSVVTFAPIDPDGDGFVFDLGGVDAPYFLIGSDGILKLRYQIDYESTSHPDANYSIIILARGTAGGAVVADGAIWISKIFVLSFHNINDNITEWSGTPPTDATIDETAGVSNAASLIVDNYQSVATFTPIDADGDGFEYTITGVAASFFTIDNDGILKLTYQLDRELIFFADGNYSIIISARGTAGGTGVADGTLWISQAFVLSVANINDNRTEWSGTPPSLVAVNEDPTVNSVGVGDKPPIAIATFSVSDADGNEFEYDDNSNSFYFDSDGVLYVTAGYNYERSDSYNAQITIAIYARGTSGGEPVGDALAGTVNYNGGMWLQRTFVLSIVNTNDEATEWSGSQPTDSTIIETVGVSNSASLNDANNYVSVATFTPTDPDGDGFEYDIMGADASFFTIDGDGILKLKYQLDYESTNHPDGNYSIIISARGTAGGTGVDDGAGADDGTLWISQAFVLSVVNLNDTATIWLVSPPTDSTINETAGVSNSVSLIVDNYQSVVTFAPTDPDGDGFEYNITGAAASFFVIGSDGILKLTYQLDHEQAGYADGNYSIIISARGTAGGTGVADGLIWISQAFVLAVGNINDNIT